MNTEFFHQYRQTDPLTFGVIIVTLTEMPTYHSGILLEICRPINYSEMIITSGAMALIDEHFGGIRSLDFATLVMGHCFGNWPDISPEDAQANLESALRGGNVLVEYKLQRNTGQDAESPEPARRLWIANEPNGGPMTIYLPEEH